MNTSIDTLLAGSTSSQPWLRNALILFTRAGSHAYGTATAASDRDYKGVAIAPSRYYFGFVDTFRQYNTNTPADTTVFDLREYMKLAADANPNILEVLFCDDSDVVKITPVGERLRAHRDAFLSQKVQYTYSGYAVSQIKRIKTHRRWLLHPPTHQPSRSEFGLPESRLLPKEALSIAQAAIKRIVDGWELDLSQLDAAQRQHVLDQLETVFLERTAPLAEVQAARQLGFADDLNAYLEQERRYARAKQEWSQYQTWKSERNQARAALEAQFGYDTKHAAHVVRLLRTGYEVLTTGRLLVRRPDAEELLAIRNGAWDYDQLVEFADRMDAKLKAAAKTTTLPRAPNRAALNILCCELVEGVAFPGKAT